MPDKINQLRRVEFEIDDDETTGVKTMSIVEDPAIGSNFILMRKQKHLHSRFIRLLLHAYEIGDFRLIDKARGKRSRESFHRGLKILHNHFQLREMNLG